MLRKANIHFYLRRDLKKPTIYCRIEVDDEKKSRSTGLSLTSEHWNQETQRVKTSHPQFRSYNETLSVIEHQIREAESNLRMWQEPITTTTILELIDQDEASRTTILDLYEDHNEKMKEKVAVGDYAQATYNKYDRIKRNVSQFIRDVYSKEDLYISELDLEFIENLEHWWKTKRRLSHNTTIKYMKLFRKILLIALRRGYIRKDPMEGWNKTMNEVVPVHLSLDELRRIEGKGFEGLDRLDKVRDIFVFACYTGLAYSDLKKLSREEDFYKDSEGDIWILQQRTKTNEPASVLLLSKAEEIYHKYDHLGDKVLPVLSNQKMNAYLKEIATVSKVKKKLTTHVARHTFATTITLGQGLPIESVQQMLGHRDRRSTEHYARVTNYKLARDMKELRRRLRSKT